MSDNTNTQAEHLMNTAEVAAYLGVTESWVRDNWRRHGIPFFRLGWQLRAKRSELDKWLSKQRAV